jgi:DnaJ-class molecular chaperone
LVRDLYVDLGVHRTATAATLRSTWQWWRDNCPPDHPRRNLAADAYSVLGDPRRRATYDEDHPRAGLKVKRGPGRGRTSRRLRTNPQRRRKPLTAVEGVLLGVGISGVVVLAALVLANR